MPTNTDLVLGLFLQLAVILAACRLVGWLLRLVGQAQVVSEMIAGVLLGPSLFGLVAPAMQRALFPTTLTIFFGGNAVTIPHPSTSILYALGQLGIAFYMFLVGLSFDVGLLRRNFRHAGSISASGIIAPMAIGGALGWLLAGDHRLFPPAIAPWQAALFLASALSVTSFPMLARIIHERGIAGTRIGTFALGAAACDDVAAWALLAIVLATAEGTPRIALLAIGGGIAYTLAVVLLGLPLLAGLARRAERDDRWRCQSMALLLMGLLLCAWFTDAIGIYAVFGAFLAGAAMPRGYLSVEVARDLEPLTVTLLLPLFFVYSGLNTRLDLLVDPALLGAAAAIVVAAFLCKGVACATAARLAGTTRREAMALGTLMNARGLMELILINIGLQRGLISPELFTALVLVAIVTTFLASPLFQIVYRKPTGPDLQPSAIPAPSD